MNKKGFTLIELLGVIILMAALVLIIIPSVSKTIKQGKEELDTQVQSNVILAARSWGVDNKDKLPTPNNEGLITLKELQNEGYIDKNVVEPSTGEKIDQLCVVVRNDDGKYLYDLLDGCDEKRAVTVITKYHCNTYPGYSVSGSSCKKSWTETTTRIQDKSYYCSSGYTLSGTSCRKTVTEYKTRLYSQPYSYCSGTMSGGQCYTSWKRVVGTVTCKDGVNTYHTNLQALYDQCNDAVYSENGDCATMINGTYHPTTQCRNRQSLSTSPGYYYCPSGYNQSGSGSSMTCYKSTTNTTSAAYTYVYYCPSGYTSSGSGSSMRCSKVVTDTKSAPYYYLYECPKGFTQIGDKNSKDSYCVK